MKLGPYLFPVMLFFSSRLRTSFQLPAAMEVAAWFFPQRLLPGQSESSPRNR